MTKYHTIIILALFLLNSCVEKKNSESEFLLLKNGRIWTGNPDQPWVDWIAFQDEKIIDLGTSSESYPTATKTIDLEQRLTLPGFNDSHVHFQSAGALLLGINLLDVNSKEGLVREIKAATSRLPKGSWITRGDWGAYEAWGVGSDGSKRSDAIFTPHREMIDGFSQDHPVLINRYYRGQGLANKLALKQLGIDSETGILDRDELMAALEKVPEKSFERRLAESSRALAECRKYGLTTGQDMSALDQVDVYQSLLQKDELPCRINFAPTELIEYKNIAEKNWVIQKYQNGGRKPFGGDWISSGTLKSHIDGIMGARTARFFQPYSDNLLANAAWRGGWREFSEDMPNFKEMILATDSADIQLRISCHWQSGKFLVIRHNTHLRNCKWS